MITFIYQCYTSPISKYQRHQYYTQNLFLKLCKNKCIEIDITNIIVK